LPSDGHFACCRKWTTWREGKGGWPSTWSIGQGREFVKTIEENLCSGTEYLKGQEKEIETEAVSKEKSNLQTYN
jgi:hypothetical protein